MANKYIVRYPIKDAGKMVIGYEILYHGEDTLYSTPAEERMKARDYAAADTIYGYLMQNNEKVEGSLNFMTFTPSLLMNKVPHLFQAPELVIQIEDSVLVHPVAMRFVQMYKRQGYRIAVNDFQFAPRYVSMLSDIDYIKLNFQTVSASTREHVIAIAESMGKRVVATGLDDEALYDSALQSGVFAMEGAAVAEKLAVPAHNSQYLRSNFFRLLVAVTREEPNIAEIEKIISADVTLSYGLLRIANTVQFATRIRAANVHQAVVNMGIGQLQRWVYLLCAADQNNRIDPYYEEFLKLSFLRANFCSELLKHIRRLNVTPGDAYLIGMFSTLPHLIDAPMEAILEELPVSDVVSRALLSHTGPGGALYWLMNSYENANWERVDELTRRLGIRPEQFVTLYFNCLEESERTWKSIQDMTS